MKSFLIILVIALSIACIVQFLFFDSKVRELKKQYRLVSKQYNSLKSTVSQSSSLLKQTKIKYVPPSFSSGITKNNSIVYLTPLDRTSIVCKLEEAHDFPILEECVIANNIWLYIEMESSDNINCRGWIQKRDFSFLKDKIQII